MRFQTEKVRLNVGGNIFEASKKKYVYISIFVLPNTKLFVYNRHPLVHFDVTRAVYWPPCFLGDIQFWLNQMDLILSTVTHLISDLC